MNDGLYAIVFVIVIVESTVEVEVEVGKGCDPCNNNSVLVCAGGTSSHSELKSKPLHSKVLRHILFAPNSDRNMICIVVSARLVRHR